MNKERWARQREANRAKGGSSFWRPQDGESTVRIVPFKHIVKPRDFALKRYGPEDGIEVGSEIEEFFLPFRRHWKPERKLCGMVRGFDGNLHGDCPTCRQQQELMRGSEEDKKVAAMWRAQTKYAVIIVDCEQDVDEMQYQLWEAPSGLVDEVIEDMDKRKYQGEDLLGPAGRDLVVTYNKNAKRPMDYYHFDWMDRGTEVDIPWDTLGPIPDPYDNKLYVSDSWHNVWAGSDEPKKEEAPPPKKPRAKKKKAPAPEEPTPPAAVSTGDTVKFLNGDDTVEATVVDGTPDPDGFIHVSTADGEQYEVQLQELVA